MREAIEVDEVDVRELHRVVSGRAMILCASFAIATESRR
jgi:hypothetical protein